MRIERERRRFPAVSIRDGLEAPQNLPVAGMDAIEIAYGQRARTKIGWYLGEAVVNPHRLLRKPDLNFQPVVSQPDVRRQQAFGALVRQVVTDMREERPPGREL